MNQENIIYFFKLLVIITNVVFIFKVSFIAHFYYFRIKSWKKVTGEITSADINYVSDSDGGGWIEHVYYKFKIDEKEFYGNQISKNLKILLPFKYQANRNNFKLGQNVNVTYNPKNPNEAVIESEFNQMNIVLPLFFFTIAYLFLW